MSTLKSLLPEDVELLAGLPYRVGVWMSHIDDDETTNVDEEKEMAALIRIITAIAKIHERSPFVKEITGITLTNEPYWRQWFLQSRNVLPDCQRAVALLEDYLNPRDLNEYRRTLMQVARTVAEAYGELDIIQRDRPPEPENENILGNFLKKVVGKFKDDDDDGEMDKTANISDVERAAMKELAQALRGKKGS